jgi:hypothetical protein
MNVILNIRIGINNMSPGNVGRIREELLKLNEPLDNAMLIDKFALDSRPLLVSSLNLETIGHEEVYTIEIVG